MASNAVPDLDLEAARVAYLVDGDPGGRSIKSKLKRAGVPEGRIVALGPDIVTPEDALSPEIFAAGVNAELERSGRAERIVDWTVPDSGRTKWLSAWCSDHEIEAPSRRSVAYRVLEARHLHPLLSDPGKRALIDVGTRLQQALS